MKTKKQEIDFYTNLYEAYIDMREYAKDNWIVRLCASDESGALVVYEKDLEAWN